MGRAADLMADGPARVAVLRAATATPSSATSAAYSGIVDLILASELRPGERTSVNLLAGRLGLGRMPVKEALNRLAAEGLFTVKERSGTTVTRIEAEDVDHMFALRRALEDLAASACGRMEARDVLAVDALIAEMRSTSLDRPEEPGAGPRFVRANAAFHAAVVAAAGNPFLDRAYGQLQLQFQIVAYLSRRGRDREAALRRQEEHEAIAAALKDRDARALRTALRTHGLSTERSLLAGLSAKRAAPPSAVVAP